MASIEIKEEYRR